MSMYHFDDPIFKICPMCKEKKPYYNCLQRYCRECAKERNRTFMREYKQTYESKAKPKKNETANKGKSLDEVLNFANTKGISYGKAVMLMSKEGA